MTEKAKFLYDEDEDLDEHKSLTEPFIEANTVVDAEDNFNNSAQTDPSNLFVVLNEFEQTFSREPLNSTMNLTDAPVDPLANLLKSWNLYEAYDILKSKQITVESLKYIKPRHIDQIFGDNMGLKIIFEHKVTLWQENNDISFSQTMNSTESINISQLMNISQYSNAECVLPFNVKTLLDQCEKTHGFLKAYEKQKALNPEQRTEMVRYIIEKYIEGGIHITCKMFNKIATEIVEIFPTENTDTYFAQEEKSRRGKGKLYDRYYARKRVHRKMDTSVSKNPAKIPKTVVVEHTELEDIRIQLERIRKWETVLKKWQLSFPMRCAEIKTKPLVEIFQRWPLYKYKYTPALVDYDFKALYNVQFSSQKWEQLCDILPRVFEQRLKYSASKELFLDLIKNSKTMSVDNIHLYYLKLLQAILTPSADRINGQRIRFTIRDSQTAFTVEVRELSDIDEFSVYECQPTIFAVGKTFHYNKFVVVFDNFKLAFDSYLSAVDFCFKLINTLNLKYPSSCINIWHFIHAYCYGLPIKTKNPKVQTFITDIKHFFKNVEP